MAMRKFIYWRRDMDKGKNSMMFANIHLLVGYNEGSITDLQSMAAELRKTFPKAEDSEIYGGHVIRSGSVQGFTLIRYDAKIPFGEYPGWTQVESGRIDYGWV